MPPFTFLWHNRRPCARHVKATSPRTSHRHTPPIVSPIRLHSYHHPNPFPILRPRGNKHTVYSVEPLPGVLFVSEVED